MSSVAPVFTEYEQQVIRELALHRFHPNAVHRVLETVGKPVGKLLRLARESNNQAIRGIGDRIQSWVEEGLIKTIQAANRMTGTREICRRFAARGIRVDDIESLRYMPMSQLDAVADSFQLGSSFILGAEGAILGGATTLAEGIPGAQLIIPSLILTDVTTSLTLLSRHTCRIASTYGFSSKAIENLPHILAAMAPQTETSDEGYIAIKTAEDYVRLLASRGMVPESGRQTTINGNRAFLGVYLIPVEGGQIPAIAAFIEYRQNLYQIIGAATDLNVSGGRIEEAIRTFDAVTEDRILRAQPDRLTLYTARQGETLAALAERYNNPRVEADELGILNRIAINQSLAVGRVVKVVTRGY